MLKNNYNQFLIYLQLCYSYARESLKAHDYIAYIEILSDIFLLGKLSAKI